MINANGVMVTFYGDPTCSDPSVPCEGTGHITLATPDRQLDVWQTTGSELVTATVNGIDVSGYELDGVISNAAAIGLPVDTMLQTSFNYFMTAELSTWDKMKCVARGLGLAGTLTVSMFACGGCLATLSGAELGPPAWAASLLTCSVCLKTLHMSLSQLIALIRNCSQNQTASTTDLSSTL